jgi:hypothetical protein
MTLCNYAEICPDIKELKASIKRGLINEDLADQAENLCENNYEYCSIWGNIRLINALNNIKIKKQDSMY